MPPGTSAGLVLGWAGQPCFSIVPQAEVPGEAHARHKLKWEAPPQGAGGEQGCGIRLWLTLSPVALGWLLSLSEPVSSLVK